MPSNYHRTYGLTTADAATLAVRADAHLGTPIVLSRAAGVTATLPAATGSGNAYEFLVATTVTSNDYIIEVANATDVMTGTAILFADGGDTVVGFATAGTSDTITMDGTTTGGITGAKVKVTDIASGQWFVEVISDASGTEATPFSAAVS